MEMTERKTLTRLTHAELGKPVKLNDEATADIIAGNMLKNIYDGHAELAKQYLRDTKNKAMRKIILDIGERYAGYKYSGGETMGKIKFREQSPEPRKPLKLIKDTLTKDNRQKLAERNLARLTLIKDYFNSVYSEVHMQNLVKYLKSHGLPNTMAYRVIYKYCDVYQEIVTLKESKTCQI
jgi:hypothetical protein